MLTITPEILVLAAGIDEFKGAWRALGAIAPERLRALRKVARAADAVAELHRIWAEIEPAA